MSNESARLAIARKRAKQLAKELLLLPEVARAEIVGKFFKSEIDALTQAPPTVSHISIVELGFLISAWRRIFNVLSPDPIEAETQES